ncbi:hypothetical protein SAMN04487949_0989 [Halogranum gelatinilyticum]|uniref:DUF7315 domain-containing protein n=1 Tax=Halogranum gelatinilyticum TaxID=660521 RepID=A0A1G9QRQ9_9EURY|nr:hypothetical protein [Halogranum gelatinilyticum]SDM13540.1 hypothetical protein SAMN04487949_0989 [Halogranum gelatinilyticum]
MSDSDTAARPTESDASSDRDADRDGRSSGRGSRDIVVPMRLYKTVTVFSTLIAVVSVVVGFVLLDAATLSVSFLRRAITSLLGALGLTVAADVLTAVLALAGLAVIGFGAGVYIIGTRFRAQGMGKSQEDSDEDSDNG